MKMFMLKSIFLSALMFGSVLFGMQLANDGIHRMKGFNDANFKGAFTVNENTGGELQVSLLGNDVDSHDLQSKKEKLEEMKAYNFFSTMGKSLAEGITNITDRAINFITDQLSS
ncbi:DUF3679 domain-containing protein (plasmid) [Bacillus sp. 31A1R]|uniref:DUF3679 domain-containing protein n=1 Tax=Robertmurraya mangrovi TaxID=3098077 RepID=A0ABU5IUU7_9BACI|nr:DUF3679 domain-containing protein [Bacillus sp. 31A1R]MDZ5470925.1 DUF3679 domain-containing protein [Bacillus sp. 31A1R]